MRRAAILALALVGCDDGGDGPIGGEEFGRLNGEPCLRLGAGNPCRGGLCLPFDGTGERGVCSEPCEDSCRFGGECVRYTHPELEIDRVCFETCVGLTSCGDDLACFGVQTLYECTGALCDPERSERTWCQPTF